MSLSPKQRAALAKGRARLRHASKATRRCWAQKAALTRKVNRQASMTASPAGVPCGCDYTDPSTSFNPQYVMQSSVCKAAENLVYSKQRDLDAARSSGNARAIAEATDALNAALAAEQRTCRSQEERDRVYILNRLYGILDNSGSSENPSWLMHRDRRSGTFTASPWGRPIRAREGNPQGLSEVEVYAGRRSGGLISLFPPARKAFDHRFKTWTDADPEFVRSWNRIATESERETALAQLRTLGVNPYVDPALAADIGRDVSALVRGHLEQGMDHNPPFHWHTFAGGTGAAEGKSGYSAYGRDAGEYHISPFTTKSGRHAGYSLKFADTGSVMGGGLWHDLGTFSSPNAAKGAANSHAKKYGIQPRVSLHRNPVTGASAMEIMSNPELLAVGLNPRRKRRYKLRVRHRTPKRRGSRRASRRPKTGRTINYRGKRYYFLSLMRKFGKLKARAIWWRRARKVARKHCGRTCVRKYLPRSK